MAGYTRTNLADIQAGTTVKSAPINAELNALVAALHATTGHKHDGTAAEGGPIIAMRDADGDTKIQVEESADEDKIRFDIAGTEQLTIEDGGIIPTTDSDIDLGTASKEFKDLYLDGIAHVDTLDVDVNATVAGTLGVTGATTLAGILSIPDGSAGNPSITNTGDTNCGLFFSASDEIAFTAGGAAQVVFADGSITPQTDNDIDLGASDLEFKDLFLDGTAHIDTLDVDANATVAGTLGVTGIATFTDDIIIGDGKTIGSASDVDAMTIASNGQITLTQTLIGTALDISGAIDVDGTTNLDVVDIDGAVQIDATFTSGVDGQGYDTKFFGDTSSAFMIWDTSADDLIFSGNAGLIVPDGQFTLGSTAVTSTAAELNLLDGVTATTAELNLLDGVTATTTELNLIDGVTATTAEINVLDGITAVVGELNALDLGSTAIGTAIASKAVILDSSKNYTGINDLTATGNVVVGGNLTVTGTTTTVSSQSIDVQNAFIFEGATDDAHKTTLSIVDPTATRTINLPNQSGTLPLLAAASNTAITSTPAELSILDGDTSATSTTLADADRFVVNDNGTMVQVALTDLETYMETSLDTLSNVTTVGALNAGSITSGFGTIDTGSSAITTTGTINFGNLADGTITVTAFVDEDNMSSNSATLVPTQQSVKAYVDSVSATANNVTGLTATGAELNVLDGASAGTIVNSKGVIYSSGGVVNATSLAIAGAALTATAAEFNLLDGVTSTTAELNLTDGSSAGTIVNSKGVIYSSGGVVNATSFAIAGTALSATAAEFNLLDGGSTVGTTTVASGDGLLTNDGGTMRQTNIDTFDTYLSATTKTLTNKTLTSPVLTTPKIVDGGFIADANGNEIIIFQTASSATNSLEITNSANGASVVIGAAGSSDSNIDIDISPKGTGEVNIAAGNLNYASTAITATGAELNLTDGASAGTIVNSKAVIYSSGGVVNATSLAIAGAALNATAAEFNILDGGTSATGGTLVDADRLIVNDNGTMVQETLASLKTYLTPLIQEEATALAIALG